MPISAESPASDGVSVPISAESPASDGVSVPISAESPASDGVSSPTSAESPASDGVSSEISWLIFISEDSDSTISGDSANSFISTSIAEESSPKLSAPDESSSFDKERSLDGSSETPLESVNSSG